MNYDTNDFGERVMAKDGYDKAMARSHLVSRTIFFGCVAGVVYGLWRIRLLEALIGACIGYAMAGIPGAIVFAGLFGAIAASFRSYPQAETFRDEEK